MVFFSPTICHGIFNPGTNPMLRLCPDRPLPPYSYVPGRFPHPIRDPSGHSYKAPGIQQETHRRSLTAPVSLASDWKLSSVYLFGIDLFNHGFYWEAHETWEQLWIEFGRSGRDADFIKGLIKLAAAGVKAREGRPIGVQRHACRAQELFRLVWHSLTEPEVAVRFGGLDLRSLCDAADAIAEDSVEIAEHSEDPLTAMLPLMLSVADIESR